MTTLREARIRLLLHKGAVFDYYGADESADGHCHWVCRECDPSKSFKSFPRFLKHLQSKHDLGVYP